MAGGRRGERGARGTRRAQQLADQELARQREQDRLVLEDRRQVREWVLRAQQEEAEADGRWFEAEEEVGFVEASALKRTLAIKGLLCFLFW